MNKNEAMEFMIEEILKIEKEEDIIRFKNAGAMKKDAVKKILKKLEEAEINEN